MNATDSTKILQISLASLPTATTVVMTIPNANFTVVGLNTTQTLLNKNIQGSTNVVDADNLKSTGTAVNISATLPPTSGQILTATSATTAIWKTPSLFNVYLNNAGTVTNPSISSLKQWYGQLTTATGTATFDITTTGAGGSAIFSSLGSAYMFVSCNKNTASSTAIPFASIEIINTINNTVTVNVQTGNSGSILIGGNYTGMQANASSCIVYLYITGT